VIGTVKGDIHEIGKTLVATLMRAAGLEVHDLGVDVPSDKFVDAVREFNADLLGLSALLTTTMTQQKNVIDALTAAGLRDKVKVMVGGAPISASWSKEIGADAYADNAAGAARLAVDLLRGG
jgi:methylmalonyl-CoA mutase cobalamin-binding domain/chain